MRPRTLAFLFIAAFPLTTPLAAQVPPGQPGLAGRLLNTPTLTTAARVASITVSPDSAVVDAGACQQFTAEARNPGGGVENVPFTFTISYADPFESSGNGLVCAKAGLLESARTFVIVGVSGSQVTATAALVARAAPPPPSRVVGGGRDGTLYQVKPPGDRGFTVVPTGPTGTANTPIPDLTAVSIRPFEARVSWTPFVNATGYIVMRDGEIITGYEPYRGGSTYIDHGVSPGFHGYSVIASLTLPDGTKTGTSPRALTTTTVVVKGYPPHQVGWLSRPNGPGSEQDALKYYRDIRAIPPPGENPTEWHKDTFDKWWRANWFNLASANQPELRVNYFNSADLEFGRDMHCAEIADNGLPGFYSRTAGPLGPGESVNHAACWVANHGPEPGTAGFPNPTRALAEAAQGSNPFAIVAMEWNRNAGVKFYAFGKDGRLVTAAALDSDGPKYLPNACLACHGGLFDPSTGQVTGGAFLPFDPSTFILPSSAGGALADRFTKLNALVANTGQQPDLITEFVAGLNHAGDNYVPPSWAGKENLYRQVIKPYCRTCHLAVRPDVIASAQQFLGLRAGLERVLCNIGSMPHAEVPFKKFWTSTNPYAPALLKAEAGITCGQ